VGAEGVLGQRDLLGAEQAERAELGGELRGVLAGAAGRRLLDREIASAYASAAAFGASARSNIAWSSAPAQVRANGSSRTSATGRGAPVTIARAPGQKRPMPPPSPQ
jgi:hypothetical protein